MNMGKQNFGVSLAGANLSLFSQSKINASFCLIFGLPYHWIAGGSLSGLLPRRTDAS